ncbi:hypothetical protein [Rufibacter hautae]|uniref:Uncharacterized protein n=1 Tax=Rufibacter hautae TaxID=2595005 RepID=A0A5B6TF71_9BACT|nr:hypothetical protein [Rufibacter hautae]KAA3437920.1 hypothetical protein FOA19_11595 [Rufibacter hautae]
MDSSTIIGLIGTVVSVFSAYLSIKAEKKAKSSATIAENAKNSVLKKQKTTSLAQIFHDSKRLQQVFGKYSIAQSNGSLKGVEFEKDGELLQNYIFSFNENRTLLQETTEIETQAVYDELNILLNRFTNSRTVNEKKDSGKQIRISIDDIIFKLKKVIDNRNSELE